MAVNPNGATAALRDDNLLSVRDLRKYYPIRGGVLYRTIGQVRAVDGVSFDVKRGETFGLVGESGCGKTTVGRAILRLNPLDTGEVYFGGRDVYKLGDNELKKLRRNMQIIFQDPYSSLDPRMPVGEIVGEGLAIHGGYNAASGSASPGRSSSDPSSSSATSPCPPSTSRSSLRY
jgi:ABC-type microcin C transport system duplicated ATPase subunit YejF